jgi:hypothetical protein
VYTAVVLNEKSRIALIKTFWDEIPDGFEIIAHHMTINLGQIKNGPVAPDLLGQTVELVVKTIAKDDLVVAVGVETDIPSKNKIKHVTLAVNRKNGGKPNMSNFLTDWQPVDKVLVLQGQVEEVA